MSFYNIYCDESCHLENDHLIAMSLGSIWCDKRAIRQVSEQVRQLKTEYGLSRQFEIKWTKVSLAQLEFYSAVINLFFKTPELHFSCERIRWIAYLITQAQTDNDISWWENKRQGNTHVVIWHELENFVVILAKRKSYYLLKTAYCTEPHRKNTFIKERDNFWQSHKG